MPVPKFVEPSPRADVYSRVTDRIIADLREASVEYGDPRYPGLRVYPRPDRLPQTMLDGLIEVLDAREKKIISHRFGLDGGKPKTLEDVGRDFGVTRERIRQLQNIALAKLRRALSKKEDLPDVAERVAA